MNRKALSTRFSIILFLPCLMAAQEDRMHHPIEHEHAARHHHYKFIDLGTLGGPHSYGELNGDSFRLLNNSGVVTSYADLSTPDPNQGYFCYDADCYQGHAFKWKNGTMMDLGALPVNNNSAGGSINEQGWVTGQSQSDVIDPVLGIPEFHAVLWKAERIIDLGTLPGGTESLGIYVNDSGQVIGFSTVDTIPDPAGFIGFPTHTFIWHNGKKTDIGTLGGGADTFPGSDCGIAPEGVVVGGATTSTAVDQNGIPAADPFRWDHGKMIDLGTLGGTNGVANCENGRGQIIGQSSLASNPDACGFPVSGAGPGCHAFLWYRGVMADLGTLGGDNSEAIWLNEQGDIAGSADLPGTNLHDAVLWRNGKIHDLGTVNGDPCSRGRAINMRGQVVGGSSSCRAFLHAFVWQDGGPMMDLNTLIQPGTGYQLTNAININDRGEILAKAAPLGFTPDDDADLGHLALLIPCDDDHADIDGCDYSGVDLSALPARVEIAPSPAIRNSGNEDRPAFGGARKPWPQRWVH
jgi:probable HAF family extracellular repeat protein